MNLLLKLMLTQRGIAFDRYIIQWTGTSLLNRLFSPESGFEVQPALVLETKGKKTGKTRAVGLPYFELEGKRMLVGSRGGSPTDPGWVYNLRANPDVRVSLHRKWYKAKARVAEGEERDRLWPQLCAIVPNYAEYQKLCERRLPVVILDPV